jgi:hypothetical protein
MLRGCKLARERSFADNNLKLGQPLLIVWVGCLALVVQKELRRLSRANGLK